MRATLILAFAAAALVLPGCGGSSGSSSSSSSSVPSTTSTTSSTATVSTSPTTTSGSASSTTTTTGTATTSSGSTTTITAGLGPCRASQLALSFLGQQGATGHGELGFALKNTSNKQCNTIGYPGVLFLDRGGGALPTEPIHTTHDFFGTTAVSALQVAPGQTVSFRLGVTHGISSPAGCSTAYGLQVIAPNDTATMRVAIPGGAYQCRTVTVSPVRPGTSAYP